MKRRLVAAPEPHERSTGFGRDALPVGTPESRLCSLGVAKAKTDVAELPRCGPDVTESTWLSITLARQVQRIVFSPTLAAAVKKLIRKSGPHATKLRTRRIVCWW
ncbi:MAG: hypothetical protein ACLP6E_08855 [Acidimicrobiales bacterium]